MLDDVSERFVTGHMKLCSAGRNAVENLLATSCACSAQRLTTTWSMTVVLDPVALARMKMKRMKKEEHEEAGKHF